MAPRNEIADSDDENLEDEPPPAPSPITPPKIHLIDGGSQVRSVNLDDVNFDQFLAQSQQYDGSRNSQVSSLMKVSQQFGEGGQEQSQTPSNNTPNGSYQAQAPQLSTSSTERVLREIAQAQHGMLTGKSSLQEDQLDSTTSAGTSRDGKLKRTRTVGSMSSSLGPEGSRKARRTKTYGGSNRLAADIGRFDDVLGAFDKPELDIKGTTPKCVDPTKLLLSQDEDNPEKDLEQDTSPQNIGSSELTFPSPIYNGLISTRTSDGSYETYTLQNGAVNQNPFLDEQTRFSKLPNKAAEIFGAFKGTSSTEPFTSLMASSSDNQHDGKQGSGYVGIGDVDTDLETTEPASDTPVSILPRESSSTPITSGKMKRQKSAMSVGSRNTSVDSEFDEVTSLDPEQHPTSIEEGIGKPKKRGRKPKMKPLDSEDILLETLAIPTKGGVERSVSTSTLAADSSPAKHPSSELNLSDEALIGLPKENYKPRPSRYGRRGSNRPDNEEESMLPPPSKQSGKNEGRKAKVKRAATSAVIFKGDPMLSDEEERDFVYLDEAPARVKMNLPRPFALEKEKDVKKAKADLDFPSSPNGENKADSGAAEGPNLSETPQRNKKTTVSVEIKIPAPSGKSNVPDNLTANSPEPPEFESINTPKPEPKKRGRKSKKGPKLAETLIIAEPPRHETLHEDDKIDAEEQDEDEDDPIPAKKRGRPPLKEKSINTTSTVLVIKENAINITNAEAESLAVAVNTTALSTPSKVILGKDMVAEPVTTPPQAENKSVGPTEHSPINPSGGKATYRVGLSKLARIPSLLRVVRKDK